MKHTIVVKILLIIILALLGNHFFASLYQKELEAYISFLEEERSFMLSGVVRCLE